MLNCKIYQPKISYVIYIGRKMGRENITTAHNQKSILTMHSNGLSVDKFIKSIGCFPKKVFATIHAKNRPERRERPSKLQERNECFFENQEIIFMSSL